MEAAEQWKLLKESFEEDLDEASTEEANYLLTERDEVAIMYKAHYPQFRHLLNDIEERHNSFFDYGD